MMRRFPMLTYQMAVFWSRRLTLAVVCFVFTIFIIALGFAGYLANLQLMSQTGWVLLPLFSYASLYILISADPGRSEYFKAIGLWNRWCRSEILAHIIIQAGFVLLWCTLQILMYASPLNAAHQFGIMTLFAAIFSQSTLSGIQSRTLGLTAYKKLALMAVVSSPWVLAAWMIGFLASRAFMLQQPSYIQTLALFILGISQILIHFALDPQKKNKK